MNGPDALAGVRRGVRAVAARGEHGDGCERGPGRGTRDRQRSGRPGAPGRGEPRPWGPRPERAAGTGSAGQHGGTARQAPGAARPKQLAGVHAARGGVRGGERDRPGVRRPARRERGDRGERVQQDRAARRPGRSKHRPRPGHGERARRVRRRRRVQHARGRRDCGQGRAERRQADQRGACAPERRPHRRGAGHRRAGHGGRARWPAPSAQRSPPASSRGPRTSARWSTPCPGSAAS